MPCLRHAEHPKPFLPGLRNEKAGARSRSCRRYMGLPRVRRKGDPLQFLPGVRREKAQPDLDLPGLRNGEHQEQILPELREEKRRVIL